MIDVFLHYEDKEYIDWFPVLPNYNDSIYIEKKGYFKIINIVWQRAKSKKLYYEPHIFLEKK